MPTHSPVEACPLLLISLITRQVVTAPYIGKVSEVSVYRIIGTALGGFWGLAMFSLGLYLISPYGSGVFVSLTSPLLVLTTTWFAFKKGLEQLARFMQVYQNNQHGTWNGAAASMPIQPLTCIAPHSSLMS